MQRAVDLPMPEHEAEVAAVLVRLGLSDDEVRDISNVVCHDSLGIGNTDMHEEVVEK